jgi:flagellar protein FliL
MRYCLLFCLLNFFLMPSVFAEGEDEVEAEEAEEGEALPPPKSIYVKLKPSFTTNLRTKSKRKLSYIKASIQLLVKGEENATELEIVMPAVRHALITYLGARTKKQASAVKHRIKLRKGALKAVRKEVEAVIGKPLVEDIFFTNFTIQ